MSAPATKSVGVNPKNRFLPEARCSRTNQQLVRVTPRSEAELPFLVWIASVRPIGLKAVPAMEVNYFVVGAEWCGYSSANRLTS
jgi:hypothetical protein